MVRALSDSRSHHVRPELSPRTPGFSRHRGIDNIAELNEIPAPSLHIHDADDWFGLQADSTPSTTAGNTNVAAVRWFDVLTNDAPREALSESCAALEPDCGPLEISSEYGQNGLTPLQRATRIVDSCPSNLSGAGESEGSEAVYAAISADDGFSWRSREDITLLAEEQALFESFLRRISSWVC